MPEQHLSGPAPSSASGKVMDRSAPRSKASPNSGLSQPPSRYTEAAADSCARSLCGLCTHHICVTQSGQNNLVQRTPLRANIKQGCWLHWRVLCTVLCCPSTPQIVNGVGSQKFLCGWDVL